MKPSCLSLAAVFLSAIALVAMTHMLIANERASELREHAAYAQGVTFGMMAGFHQTSTNETEKAHYLEVGAEYARFGFRVENGKFVLPEMK